MTYHLRLAFPTEAANRIVANAVFICLSDHRVSELSVSILALLGIKSVSALPLFNWPKLAFSDYYVVTSERKDMSTISSLTNDEGGGSLSEEVDAFRQCLRTCQF